MNKVWKEWIVVLGISFGIIAFIVVVVAGVVDILNQISTTNACKESCADHRLASCNKISDTHYVVVTCFDSNKTNGLDVKLIQR